MGNMNINTKLSSFTGAIGNALQKPYTAYRELLFANNIENNERNKKLLGATALIGLEGIVLAILFIPRLLYSPLLLVHPLMPATIALATLIGVEISLGFLALLGKLIVYLHSFRFNTDNYKKNQ